MKAAIPDPGNTLQCLQAIKEWIETRDGQKGHRDAQGKYPDRFVSVRELEDILLTNAVIANAIKEVTHILGGFGQATKKTISAGEITVSGNSPFRYHTVDTEGGAATDDLETVNGGSPGDILLLKAESGSRTVIIRNTMSLQIGSLFRLDHIADGMLLYCISEGVWYGLTKYNAG